MLCPSCGQRPFSFGRWLRTLDPFNVECTACGTSLHAARVAYGWTLVHVPIAIALTAMIRSPAARESRAVLIALSFLALAILFITAYVVPYYYLDRCYRVSDSPKDS